MSKELLFDPSKTVNEFMAKRGWQGNSCGTCGRTFFFKPTQQKEIFACGWHKCDKGDGQFRTLSKRRSMLTPAQINSKLSQYFNSVGVRVISPLNIANSDGKTDLVIAGVQIFDGVIHGCKEICKDGMFLSQPCVRMQFQPQVGVMDGTSTSFVNVCTEKMGCSFDEHLEAVDHWCTVLSKLGLHMNDFVVVMRSSTNDWGTGEFTSLELFFVYGGLELGDAAYFSIPQANRSPIPISDIGFGLERIAWAVNKTETYYKMLVPLTLDGTTEMFDSCRTLALLALCGVQAANKGPGLQFRRFAKVLGEKYYGNNLFQALAYYFDYWSQFIKPSISREDAVQLVRLEVERLINLKICDALKLPSPRNETIEAYFERLVYTCNVDINELRKTLQICKT